MKRKIVSVTTVVVSFFTICVLFTKPIKSEPTVVVNSNIQMMELASGIEIQIEETEEIITEHEYNLLLRVCMSECGGKYGEPLEGKIAVVETILNRSEIYGKSIEEVIYEPNQYSLADNGEPDETVQHAVDIALRENIYPDDMIYFRTMNYHNFGEPYQQIGNHYFSLKESE